MKWTKQLELRMELRWDETDPNGARWYAEWTAERDGYRDVVGSLVLIDHDEDDRLGRSGRDGRGHLRQRPDARHLERVR